ncbi:signal peptidase I SipW [Bacillus marinisedimentorum]|uniref:signal peptidase I SipW n=1 Tax=Bacillus marinisedimentorum TaxID=1821260 RepID=UPI001FDFAD47|nr:signal peptidase I [Bacillus marinisedimentorum]
MKILGNLLYAVVFITLLISTTIVISARASGGEPELNGYQLKTVLSGSMDPTFKTGSLILTKIIDDPKTIKKNDIITFKQDENTVVTHRVIEVLEDGNSMMFRTQGDNNENADMNPVLAANVVAEYTGYTVPYVGYFLNYAASPIGTALLLIIPGLVLLGYAVILIRQAIKEIEKQTKQASA